MNKKERRAALKSALTSKVQDNKLVVVDSLALAEVKTKEMQKGSYKPESRESSCNHS